MQLCLMVKVSEHNDVADVVMDRESAMIDELMVHDLIVVVQAPLSQSDSECHGRRSSPA